MWVCFREKSERQRAERKHRLTDDWNLDLCQSEKQHPFEMYLINARPFRKHSCHEIGCTLLVRFSFTKFYKLCTMRYYLWVPLSSWLFPMDFPRIAPLFLKKSFIQSLNHWCCLVYLTCTAWNNWRQKTNDNNNSAIIAL